LAPNGDSIPYFHHAKTLSGVFPASSGGARKEAEIRHAVGRPGWFETPGGVEHPPAICFAPGGGLTKISANYYAFSFIVVPG
jgi:hypothetical protein